MDEEDYIGVISVCMFPLKYLADFVRIHYAVSWFFFVFDETFSYSDVARFLYNFFLNSLKFFFYYFKQDISVCGKIFMLFKICVFFLIKRR